MDLDLRLLPDLPRSSIVGPFARQSSDPRFVGGQLLLGWLVSAARVAESDRLQQA